MSIGKNEKPTFTIPEHIKLNVERVPAIDVFKRVKTAPRLLHYMADFGSFNRANPHLIPKSHTRKVDFKRYNEQLDMFLSLDYVLQAPDRPSLISDKKDSRPPKKRTSGEIALTAKSVTEGPISRRDWLTLKLSKDAWDHDTRYRGIVRNLIAIAVEGNDEKMNVLNQFICQIEPYSMHTRQQSSKSKTAFGAVRGLVSGDNNTYFLELFDDFTICNWTRLLCLAEQYPDKIKLSEAAKTHIKENLLVLKGPKYDGNIRNTDNSFFRGIASLAGFEVTEDGIQNSENHLLMVNGSAYIRNQMETPNINPGSDLEIKLCKHLDLLFNRGLTEFNSIPYAGFTLDALINLHDFAKEPVKSRATRVLDKIFYDYAVHSTQDGKSFRPFARLTSRGTHQDFANDNHMRAFISSWLGLELDYYCHEGKQSAYAHYAFTGSTTTYRLPSFVYELATSLNDGGYLAMTGQPCGNAEISYKNTFERIMPSGKRAREPIQYLLSGGGVRDNDAALAPAVATSAFKLFVPKESTLDREAMKKWRIVAEVVSRNPVLILNGKQASSQLKDAFFLGTDKALEAQTPHGEYGPGADSIGKNNSGIYFDFMVGAYPVHVPDAYKGKGTQSNHTECSTQPYWTLYEIEPGLCIAVFDGKVPVKKNDSKVHQVGIVLVLPKTNAANAQALIDTIVRENSDIHTIGKQIKFPNDCGSIMRGKRLGFNPYAALDRYIMTSCDGVSLSSEDRVFYQRAIDHRFSGRAKGWSPYTAIQTTPESAPVSHSMPNDDSYQFMHIVSPSKHIEDLLEIINEINLLKFIDGEKGHAIKLRDSDKKTIDHLSASLERSLNAFLRKGTMSSFIHLKNEAHQAFQEAAREFSKEPLLWGTLKNLLNTFICGVNAIQSLLPRTRRPYSLFQNDAETLWSKQDLSQRLQIRMDQIEKDLLSKEKTDDHDASKKTGG